MLDSFVVEANRRDVGVAVRCAEGYRFFASDRDFTSLDKKTFKRARALATAIGKHAKRLLEQHRKAGVPRLP